MSKTIILVIPHHFGIFEGFVSNLEKLGFDIELVYLSNTEFRYKNISERITNFFLKNIFRNKGYKKNLKEKYDDRCLTAALSKIDKKVDFALVIRPDYFSREVLEILKSKATEMIAYQWDGLNRYPKAMDLINLFDRFYLFDYDDYTSYKSTYSNLYPTNNFYFDSDFGISENTEEKQEKEAFFIGSFIENRIDEIIFITNIFKDLKLKTNINLLYFDEKSHLAHKHSDINFIDTPLTYLEVLEMVKKSDVVLDFVDSVHNGLSLRTFEALRFSKKLITNNLLVKNYDFYSEDNILVWENVLDIETLKDFLDRDYQKIDEDILAKYSFTNWIHTVLNLTKA
ncbi:MAG: hypothetical protein L6264_00300 [Weeksellaceae bacterium]|nr:hypothetical protein [Bacteroidota bacterium]MCG2779363.1 hypothetical protein [Weeksellaceae bacterium]